MSVYLDANIIVALFVPDALTPRATSLIKGLTDPVVVSDLAELEFVSTVGRLVRAGELNPKAGREACLNFDHWASAHGRSEVHAADVAAATSYARRFDINLHGADAIHVAMAARGGAKLLTLDAKMKANAKKLGVPVI